MPGTVPSRDGVQQAHLCLGTIIGGNLAETGRGHEYIPEDAVCTACASRPLDYSNLKGAWPPIRVLKGTGFKNEG